MTMKKIAVAVALLAATLLSSSKGHAESGEDFVNRMLAEHQQRQMMMQQQNQQWQLQQMQQQQRQLQWQLQH